MRRARAVLGLALLATPLAGQAVVGLAPATVLLAQGGRATVPLVANMTNAGGAQLGAYQLQITFDPAVLRYVGIAPGAFGAPTINTANAATGTLTLAGANPAGAGGVVTLANVTFEMLVASGSSLAAIGTPTLTAAGTFSGIAVNTVSASFCTAAGTYGDIDNDGNVLGNDALIVVTSAVGLPIAPYTLANADVDQNGTVDTRDALFILSYAVGLPTPLTRVGQPNAGACGGPAPQTLALQPSPVQLAPGDVLALIPNALDSTGIPTVAHGLAWFSTNAGVATVDTLGVVTAVANGTDSVVAMTVAGPADTAVITVANRHTWYVNGAVTLDPSQQLGSSAFPFATIPQALARAAAGDTVRIAGAPSAYGPATIAKPVIVLGDTSAAGMPTISNSAGNALSVNTSGRVVLQWLNLDQSNGGVDATGDTLETQSLSFNALRGPGVRVHGMQRADLRGLRVTSATLAGVWIENTASAAVSDAALSVIAARNDSAAGVVVLNSGAADLSNVTVFGVDQDGPGIVTDSVTRATITNYASNTGSALSVQRGRFASVSGAVLAGGGCGDPTSSSCNAAIHFQADTSVVDTVQLFNPGRGIDLQPHRGSALPSQAKITRSTLSAVQYGTGVHIDSVGDVAITGLAVDTVLFGDGIVLSNGSSAVLKQVAVRHVCDVCVGLGTAVRAVKVDNFTFKQGVIRDAIGQGVEVHQATLVDVDSSTIHSVALAGVAVDSAFVVRLLAVSVDSSAPPDFRIFNAPVLFAVRVTRADTVHADSLDLHDNFGAGLLVDSALVVTGTGGTVARNFGQGGFGGDCGPNGCTCVQCIGQGLAPRPGARALPPIGKGGSLVQFQASTAPGVVLSNVSYGQLAHFTVDSNAKGGILIAPTIVSNWIFILDSSFVRGGQTLLSAGGNVDSTGRVTVRGTAFHYGAPAVSVSYLDQLLVQGSTFDSTGASSSPALGMYQVNGVSLLADTLREGPGSGVEMLLVGNAQVRNSLIHHRTPYCTCNPEAGLGLGANVITVSNTRIELNTILGIRVDAGLTGAILIDSSAITDDSLAAIQASSPTVVTNTLLARNLVGADFLSGTDGSQVRFSNIENNVLAGVRNQNAAPMQADNDWWNDARGPRCASSCDSTSLGDSAVGAVNPLTPFLTTPSGSAPAFAPPIRTARAQARKGRP
ncbi:MAG TPA: dockerin type I domain-containing protein [Gemmatimonadales bacterium]